MEGPVDPASSSGSGSSSSSSSAVRLADALNGVKLCTQRLVFTVDKLDKRLGTVDTKMQQIKGATDRYLRAKDNISNVLAEIEKINEYFKVAKQVEPVVKAGLTGQPHEAFFGAVTRLHEAQRYFASRKKEIKAAGPALKAIDALLKKAVASCLDELERLLKAYGKSVEAVAGQFRVVTPDAEGLRIIDSVRGICGCLDATAHIEHLQTYQRLRAAQALGDLQAHETASMAAWEGLLQDAPYQKGTHPLQSYATLAHETLRGELQLWRAMLLKTSPGTAGPSASASASTSSGGGSARTSKEAVSVFAAVADAVVMEMQRVLSPFLFEDDDDDGPADLPAAASAAAASGKKKRGGLRLKSVVNLKFLKRKPLGRSSVPDLINRQSNSFLIRLDMLDIFMARYGEMRDLCRGASAELEAGRQVRFQAQPPQQPPPPRAKAAAAAGSSGGGADVDAAAVEALTTMRDAIVEACVDSIAQLLASTREKDAPAHPAAGAQAAAAAAGAGAGGGGTDSEPLSCDLQPITGNVLYCCKELMHFTHVYQQMHRLAVEIDVTLPTHAPTLIDLVATLLDNLFKTLQTKAKLLDPVEKSAQAARQLNVKGHALFDAGEKDAAECLLWARRHLFLVNNLHSLHTYLHERKRELAQYTGTAATATAAATGAGVDSMRQMLRLAEAVDAKLADEQALFCDAVAAACSVTAGEMAAFASEYNAADRATKAKLLKAKFSLFNSAMDAFLAQQGEWRVSSAALREQLGAALVAKVCPRYTQFFTTYSAVGFSKKHTEEYLRFPPADVDRALRYFFGKS